MQRIRAYEIKGYVLAYNKKEALEKLEKARKEITKYWVHFAHKSELFYGTEK